MGYGYYFYLSIQNQRISEDSQEITLFDILI